MPTSPPTLTAIAPRTNVMVTNNIEKTNACKIGKIMTPDYGLKMVSYEGEEWELPYFSQDEIVKLFTNQQKEKNNGI